MGLHAFKHFRARHPVTLVFGMVGALDGKSAQASAHGIGDIEAKDDDVGPGHRIDGEPMVSLAIAH